MDAAIDGDRNCDDRSVVRFSNSGIMEGPRHARHYQRFGAYPSMVLGDRCAPSSFLLVEIRTSRITPRNKTIENIGYEIGWR